MSDNSKFTYKLKFTEFLKYKTLTIHMDKKISNT